MYPFFIILSNGVVQNTLDLQDETASFYILPSFIIIR